ncbi:hypothetical protein M1K46_13540 [Fictibacillus sp. WQ 8-8]|nr:MULTISPECIES: hypothetical protein [unclassified Fictibacillus]MCQ6266681.1 hypothetical protein [Fictibacillus sp. WQ 8-8]MED2971388.1 hypothetical protein [Fictibacillus sp. B-59209]UZJ80197.1 hypothetical protein OKX00_06960 [Fictibacillus sp. KU28468]SFD55516.1 hypothetical protein SAMN05428981_101879 [Bacillus sp. OV194]
MENNEKKSNENGKKETKKDIKDMFEQGAIEQRESVDTDTQKEKDKKQK